MAKVAKALKTLNKKNRSRMLLNNLGLSAIAAAILSACGGGGSCGNCVVPSGNSQLIFVAPSILPSLANKTGVNYMGVYNPSSVAISGISYSVGQQVGSGNSITLDQSSAAKCANIPAQSSCFLKFSVPESTIAGGTVVTASNSDGSEAATPLAMGVQQVAYTESANANGVGLYFYPKAQYSESGVPFILVTAVVQSPNVGNVNTIELVDESGNVIPNQVITSGNSGAGKTALQMGDVVEIALPLPQGINLTQNLKVQTSYQTLTTSTLDSIAEKLNLKNQSLKATTNTTTGSTTYSVQTQSNNINLQFTPNQVYLTQQNSIQYGYLYNIGDLTASQIAVSSSSPNVRVTAADAILNAQRVIKVTYELINTTVAPATNTVTVTAVNPSGQTETTTGNTNQNVNPDIVPTPSPSPTPTPTPAPTPTPTPGPAPTPTWSMVGGTIVDSSLYSAVIAVDDSNNVYAGGETSSEGDGSGKVWQYNGTSWSQLGGALPNSISIFSMVINNGTLYAGGQGPSYGGAVWKYENAWSIVGGVVTGGVTGSISSILVKNNVIYAGGGEFSNNTNTGGVWEFNNNTWSQITGSLITGSYNVFSIAFDSSDNIYAGGTINPFPTPGGGVWTGNPWSLANSSDISAAIGVASIALDDSNNVYVCGYTSSNAAVWKYDSVGNSWAMLGGTAIPNSKQCNSMVLSGGNVYAAGQTNTDTGILWKYDGTTWSSVGGEISGSYSGYSLVIKNGVFYVGGRTPGYKGAVWQYK